MSTDNIHQNESHSASTKSAPIKYPDETAPQKKLSILSVDSCPPYLISPDCETKSIGDPVLETSLAIRKLSEALSKFQNWRVRERKTVN